MHGFYQSTFDRKWGNPSLTRDFFERVGNLMGDKILIVFAYDDADPTPDWPVACSIMFIGSSTLYGRFWGCRAEYNSLHFEACYYQGIEYCIDNGLGRFEAGAQGEHKLNRGLLPVTTWSAHWISHPQFANAIDDFLEKERKGVDRYVSVLQSHSPFRQTETPSVDSTAGDDKPATGAESDSASPDDVTDEPV